MLDNFIKIQDNHYELKIGFNEDEYQKIKSALKLQELVKEKSPFLIKSMNEFKQTDRVEYNFQRAKVEILQSLIEESEK